jgi:hypothetical protein
MRKSILGKYYGSFYAKGAIRAKEGDQGSHQALYRVHHAGPLLGHVVQALFNLVGPLDESFGMTPYERITRATRGGVNRRYTKFYLFQF